LRQLQHNDVGYRLYEAAVTLTAVPWYLAASVDDALVLASANQRAKRLALELLGVAVLVTLVALALGSRLSRRVIALRDVTQRFAGGDRDVRATEDGHDELTDLSRAVNRMAMEIAELVRSLEHRTRELEADIAERLRLEEQLVQSRKLEAIGQLAGGIAHDYNNTLTVIMQSAESIADDGGSAGPFADDLRTLRDAAERAAGLTRQLLTFARRQPIEPRDLDLNAAVADVSGLLRGLLAGRHRLLVVPAPTPLPVRMDPSQLTQVLLNLAANARDAFGDHPGSLTIRLRAEGATPDAPASDATHAVLEAQDTGCGMDANTVSRMFEPFFTTKGDGRGTGLGLATVFGIISQAGGTIAVESAPGEGTTFRIRLPLRDAR
jgi:signal transduction histidine kinase